jgi:hypothetical protein
MPAHLDHVVSHVLVDRARRELGAADGLDDGRAAIDRVAGGEVLRVSRASVCVDRDRACGRLDAVDPRENSARGRWPIALTTVSQWSRNSVPGPPRGGADLTRPARRPRVPALDRLDLPVTEEAKRDRQDSVHPFIARLFDLVRKGGHLGLGPPVDERGVGRAEAQRLARDVDGVAAADHSGVPADAGRRPRRALR